MFDVNNEINELIDCYNESVELEIAMEAYDIIADELQNKVNSGELTLEDAEILNDMAYDKYVVEARRLTEEIHKRAPGSDVDTIHLGKRVRDARKEYQLSFGNYDSFDAAYDKYRDADKIATKAKAEINKPLYKHNKETDKGCQKEFRDKERAIDRAKKNGSEPVKIGKFSFGTGSESAQKESQKSVKRAINRHRICNLVK